MRDAGGTSDPASRARSQWRDFRRARHALWCLLVLLVVLGVLLHDLMASSPVARFAGTSMMVLLVAYPLGFLLGFHCPRCGEAYLTTGGLRDFLGLGRILWSRRCGRCALPAGGGARGTGPDDHAHDVNGSELPDSRPAT